MEYSKHTKLTYILLKKPIIKEEIIREIKNILKWIEMKIKLIKANFVMSNYHNRATLIYHSIHFK